MFGEIRNEKKATIEIVACLQLLSSAFDLPKYMPQWAISGSVGQICGKKKIAIKNYEFKQ